MPNWRFWKNRPGDNHAGSGSGDDADNHAPAGEDQPRTAVPGTPHPARQPGSALSPERRARRIADLEHRRDGLLYDIEQGELAASSDNPWAERIALLRESLETIAADRERLETLAPEPTWAVPDIPVTNIQVTTGEPASVAFNIDGSTFRFAEVTDWDNRGGMIVRGDLRPVSGDARSLPLPNEPALANRYLPALIDALAVFAVALRDAALDGKSSSNDNTLRDVIHEDTETGGWRNVHGTNPIQVQRSYERQALRAERDRIEAEIAAEEEQRRTLVDRLPIARKRLAGVLEDLDRLGAGSAG